MSDIVIQRSDWQAMDGQWQALVRDAFHPDFIGMGELYAGVSDAQGIIDQMLRYIDGLPVWAAWDGNRLVGLLSGKITGDRLALYEIYVASSHQRQGIGRRLVEYAIQETQARVVTAEVNRANAASQGLFRSLSFECQLTTDWLVLRRD